MTEGEHHISQAGCMQGWLHLFDGEPCRPILFARRHENHACTYAQCSPALSYSCFSLKARSTQFYTTITLGLHVEERLPINQRLDDEVLNLDRLCLVLSMLL
jgi:hypothetical protein